MLIKFITHGCSNTNIWLLITVRIKIYLKFIVQISFVSQSKLYQYTKNNLMIRNIFVLWVYSGKLMVETLKKGLSFTNSVVKMNFLMNFP